MTDTFMAEFPASETHGFIELEGCTVIRTSEGLGWSKAFMSVHAQTPYRRSFTARPDILLAVTNSGSFKARVEARNHVHDVRGAQGSVTIIPDQVSFDIEQQSRNVFMHLYLRRSIIDEIVVDTYQADPRNVEIKLQTVFYDSALERLCQSIRDVLDDRSSISALYVEHMTLAIGAYLLRYHSTIDGEGERGSTNGKLSSRQLTRARELVEARLGERLTLREIALEVGLGADHFGRLFKQDTGLSVYQYVIRCRVDRARHLLADTLVPIAEIAQECGFADQVHLTRTFRRVVGVTPATYRKMCRN